MLAVQLDIFSGQPVAPSFESAAELDQRAKRQGILDMILNPCEGCDLREFCGSDGCGKYLFDLDLEEPETDPEDDDEDEDYYFEDESESDQLEYIQHWNR